MFYFDFNEIRCIHRRNENIRYVFFYQQSNIFKESAKSANFSFSGYNFWKKKKKKSRTSWRDRNWSFARRRKDRFIKHARVLFTWLPWPWEMLGPTRDNARANDFIALQPGPASSRGSASKRGRNYRSRARARARPPRRTLEHPMARAINLHSSF